MDRYKNIPPADEFNKKMHQCVEYKKLKKLKEQLNWFNGKIGNINRPTKITFKILIKIWYIIMFIH